MSNRPIRFRGTDYPVIEQFQIGRRHYPAVAKIGSVGRRAYKVFDTAARQMRVLHVLPDSEGTLQRVQTLRRLTRGDNEILQILDFGREQGSIRVVLPWIDGFNLRAVLSGIRDRGRPRIATPEAVRLLKGVAHAVHHLHRHKQIVHGDIKPANLILTKRTSLVLIDYGNAWTIERTTTRHEGDGVSQVYAAPEFIRGERSVNFRADCFSVGVVLYEILTGKLPWDGQGGKAGLLPNSARSGLRLLPSSELSPERNQLSSRVWQPIDSALASHAGAEAVGRQQSANVRWRAARPPGHCGFDFAIRLGKPPPAVTTGSRALWPTLAPHLRHEVWRDPAFQVRIMADEVVNLQSTGTTKFHASVFNAMPAATVTWRMPDDAEWQDMQRVVEPDLLLLERWREGQPNQETLPWRDLLDPMPSAQLWQATFPEKGLARNLRR